MRKDSLGEVGMEADPLPFNRREGRCLVPDAIGNAGSPQIVDQSGSAQIDAFCLVQSGMSGRGLHQSCHDEGVADGERGLEIGELSEGPEDIIGSLLGHAHSRLGLRIKRCVPGRLGPHFRDLALATAKDGVDHRARTP